MTDTPAERKRRQRLRQCGALPDLQVCACGRQIRGDRSECSRCWLKTPDGREWQRLRIQAYRVRNKK